MNASMSIWQIQSTLKRGEMVQVCDLLLFKVKTSSKRISNSKRKLRIEGARLHFLVNKILLFVSFWNSFLNSFLNSFWNSF